MPGKHKKKKPVKAKYGGYMSTAGNTAMTKKKEEDKMKAGHGGMAYKKKAKKK
jgi:hypothetical protein